jgi:hypothetical protein
MLGQGAIREILSPRQLELQVFKLLRWHLLYAEIARDNQSVPCLLEGINYDARHIGAHVIFQTDQLGQWYTPRELPRDVKQGLRGYVPSTARLPRHQLHP